MTLILIDQDPWILGELCEKILYLDNNNLTVYKKEDLLEKQMRWSWKS